LFTTDVAPGKAKKVKKTKPKKPQDEEEIPLGINIKILIS